MDPPSTTDRRNARPPGFLKPLAIESSTPLASIDICILVYLLGEAVSPDDSIQNKRESLVGALCEWLGGDAWIWMLADIRVDNEMEVIDSLHRGFDGTTGTILPGKVALANPRRNPGIPSCVLLRHDGGSNHTIFQGRLRSDGHHASVGIFRKAERKGFTRRELRLGRIILDEVRWLYEEENPVTGSSYGLPPRQKTVMDLLLQGWDRKRIAEHLKISPNTLAGHIKEIYRRLGVRSLAALVRIESSGNPP
jgi:DNA-binding CsgD family transcriptional regulator